MGIFLKNGRLCIQNGANIIYTKWCIYIVRGKWGGGGVTCAWARCRSISFCSMTALAPSICSIDSDRVDKGGVGLVELR